MINSSLFALLFAVSIAGGAFADAQEVADSTHAGPDGSSREFTVQSPVSLDWSGEKSETIFFILGMLNEYHGRSWTEGINQVERFNCGEYGEAFVFLVYLERLASEQGVDRSVDTRWDDCLVFFHSDPLADLINSFYVFAIRGGYTMIDDQRRSRANANLSYDQFEAHGRDAKLAYLAGAYFRYNVGGHYAFANASHKMKLIARLLEEAGCADVEIRSRWGMPANNEVHFEPTEELSAVFARLPGEWSLTAADTLVGFATDDELAVYRTVIRAMQQGDFDDCAASTPCAVARFLNVSYRGERGEIPDTKPWMKRALEQLDGDTTRVVSVARLQSDSIVLANARPDFGDTSFVWLGPIGFDPGNGGAVVIVSHLRLHPGSCGQQVAAFLKRRGDGWVVTNYSVAFQQRMPKRRRRLR